MLGFNYEKFKAALKKEEERKFQELKQDIAEVQLFFEKALDKFFNSTSNLSRMTYPGVDL